MARSAIVAGTLVTLAGLLGAGFFYTASPSSQAESTTRNHTIYVGLSPYLSSEDKKVVQKELFRLILDGMKHTDSLSVYDAYHLKLITQFAIPDNTSYNNPNVRVRLLKNNLRDIKSFFQKTPPIPDDPCAMSGAIRVPQFVEFIGETATRGSGATSLMLLGSPLYVDAKEAAFSMCNGLFPSDGHLLVNQNISIFGVAEKDGLLDGIRIHFGYFGDPWFNARHAHRVERFWQLFIKRQGGEFVTFLGDLPTVSQRIHQSDVLPLENGDIDPQDAKVEMLSARIDLPPPWLRDGGVTPAAPTDSIGQLKIGIIWDCLECDLDLYARPTETAPELFYRRVRTKAGQHFKDYRTFPNPKNGLEYIEFTSLVDIRAVTAAVKFYKGKTQGGATGQVRVFFNGKTYSGKFMIPSPHGNRGEDSKSREGSAYWTTLDIPTIVGLRPKGNSGSA